MNNMNDGFPHHLQEVSPKNDQGSTAAAQKILKSIAVSSLLLAEAIVGYLSGICWVFR